MRYMLLIYESEANLQKMTEEDGNRVMGEYMAFTDDIRRSGQYVAGAPLQPTPADVLPSALLMLNVIAPAGLVSAALVLASGGDAKKVLLAVGIPATKFPVGIGGDALLTSVSIFGG